ncbi:MAG: CidA/LrgA family protein [Alphaproteobacteria bacterium]
MIGALVLILLCQLAGETAARLADLPIPGPVLGAVLLFLILALRRRVDEPLNVTATTLLSHLSLLFVPAGVGVIVHLERLRSEWLALGAALLLSTMLTIVVAALVFRLVARRLEKRAAP